MNKRQVGSNYEEVAVQYLVENGYEILYRNYRNRLGEIDIIGKDGGYLCFIEVKYRSSTRFGHPLEAVNYKKQTTIRRVAEFFVFSHKCSNIKIRFDVVSICGRDIQIYKNAF